MMKTIRLVFLLLLMLQLSCRESVERRSEQRTNNQVIPQVVQRQVEASGTYNDLINSIGKKVEDMSKNAEVRQQLLEESIKGYRDDRKQMQAIFESITDRLNGMDRSMTALQQRLGDLQQEVQNKDSSKPNRNRVE
ncbi:MAG: hypothetical protein IT292_12440 [Deltaproteobacteria bacterium]|nr:hypothetical protein [Deltaproteobacteria bacterium]